MRKFFLLLFLCMVGSMILAEKVIEFPDLMKPRIMKIDEDEMFIAEGFNVKVYSLKSGKMKFKFGKQGEGPGEFRMYFLLNVFILPDCVYAQSHDKVAWFSREGKFLKEKGTPNAMISLIPIGDKFIGVDFDNSQLDSKNIVYQSISIYDSNIKIIKTIYRNLFDAKVIFRPGINTTAEYKMIGHYYGADCDIKSEKIIVSDSRKGFYIEVFDGSGKKLYSINKKFEKIKVPEDYKKRALEKEKIQTASEWQLLKRRKFTFYKYFPPFWTVKFINGKIYVGTYKMKDNDFEFIILNVKGNILKRVFLPIKEVMAFKDNLFHFDNGKFYNLIENEEKEIWELHIHELK